MSFAIALEMELMEADRIKAQKAREYYKIYYQKNREKIIAAASEYQKGEASKRWAKSYRIANRAKKAAQMRVRRAKRTLEQKARDAKTFRDWNNARLRSDPFFKVLRSIRGGVSKALKGIQKNKVSSQTSYHKYFGCDKETLRAHIESLFREGMSWENYGKVWHLDHIVPISLGKKDYALILKLCNYKNLQPLFAAENIEKRDAIPKVWPEGVPFSREDFGL